MLFWRRWCRLCGGYEQNQEVEQEVEVILLQIFEVQAEGSCICLDCNAYVRDFQDFILKSRSISEMFEDLSRKEDENGDIDDNLLLQTRLIFGLPLPDVDLGNLNETETNEDSDIVEDIAEVVNFKIEEDSINIFDNNSEYVFETEEPKVEQLEEEEFNEDSWDSQQNLSENEGDIKELADGFEYILDDDVDLVTEEELANQEEYKEQEIPQETDDISQHFEFRCQVCEKKFHKMCFLTIHTKTVHSCPARVACSCGKFLTTVRAVIHHYETHIKNTSSFHCVQCNKFYKTETNYQNHMQTHHSDADNDGRKYRCECGKSFKEARHLVAHANSHLPNEQKFVHQCPDCQKNYSSIFSLRQHIKHVHEKVPTFKCLDCGKMFSRKANLDSHVSHVHTSVRNYECDICGLKVKTKGILRVHKKIHSTNPEDLQTCEVCQRQFKTQNQLTNHKVSHSTVKRHKCGLCSAEYKRSKELICHIASAHTGESKYTCQWCSKSFFNNSNYRKHKLKMHPTELEIEKLSLNVQVN